MPEPNHAERARATFRALHRGPVYSRRRHLFGRRLGIVRHYETLWPYANAWSAACTLASSPAAAASLAQLLGPFRPALASYHRQRDAVLRAAGPVGFESCVVPPLGPGGEMFYDDNEWIGLALVRQHELTGDPGVLSLARRILDFTCSGWAADPSWYQPGGIRWKQPAASRSRNTCSNGPCAELAVLVYLHTGEQSALDWAARIYRWVRSALLGPDNLYWDHVLPDGRVDRTVWCYNQGTMIGAGVLLHRATGEPGYLDQAVATAGAAMRRYSVGPLVRQGPAFSAVFLRNLLLLGQAAPDPAYRQLALGYGAAMWDRRDARTGLFPGRESFLNATAPMAQVYALLAGAPPHA
jgi:hypothetical protein